MTFGPQAADALRDVDADLYRDAPRGEWPDPYPLPEALQSVDPFDFNLLPEKLRPWAADAAERMQCPPDYLASWLPSAP
jgi:hypothetical protein